MRERMRAVHQHSRQLLVPMGPRTDTLASVDADNNTGMLDRVLATVAVTTRMVALVDTKVKTWDSQHVTYA